MLGEKLKEELSNIFWEQNHRWLELARSVSLENRCRMPIVSPTCHESGTEPWQSNKDYGPNLRRNGFCFIFWYMLHGSIRKYKAGHFAIPDVSKWLVDNHTTYCGVFEIEIHLLLGRPSPDRMNLKGSYRPHGSTQQLGILGWGCSPDWNPSPDPCLFSF